MGSLKQMDLFRIVLDGDRPVVQETILHGVDRIRDVRVGPEAMSMCSLRRQLLRLVPVH